MEKINVSFDLQCKVKMNRGQSFIACDGNHVLVFHGKLNHTEVIYLEILNKDYDTTDWRQCELTTGLNNNGTIKVSQYRLVGTGNINQSNINKAFRMIKGVN